MPELPEVETIRRQLEERLPSRTIVSVRVTDPRLVAPDDPDRVAAGLAGRRIRDVRRRGKYLLIGLEGGDDLAAHLRMTGRLHLSDGPPDPEERFRRAVIALDDGSHLTFSDQRRFGRLWTIPAGDSGWWRGRLGVEPLGAGFTARRLEALLAGRRAPIKALLLDQRLVAGIGNIYADEALFQAGIHPERAGGSLSREEAARLHRAVRDRLRAGIATGGASIDSYRDGLGRRGTMQDALRVHLHAGDPCPRCRTPIVKIRVAQRGTYLCPECQPR
jgi:formamidopyrimidine-DNA glycosylase